MAANPLERYNAKRDFARTAEPAGTLAPGHGNSFVVQKHDATRLHWDFRLEMDGVLKSWAVTRGPSLNPDDKRLAVRTEDHPLGYASFEGTIPKGEYGGGTVMLWDQGTWSPIKGKHASDIDDGHLHFVLNGERMKGEWLLIRLKPRGREKNENWLLRKVEDSEAGGSDTLVELALTSVATGRTMAQIAEGVPPRSSPGRGGGRRSGRGGAPARKRRGEASPLHQPRAGPSPPAGKDFTPQLCTLVDSVPTGSGWLHEVKYDGYRALIHVAGGRARVMTRSGLDWTEKFPGIAAAAAELPVDSAVIDAEIVALKDGRPDFSTLKDSIASGGDMIAFAFDLLALDGEDLRDLPNSERKARLRPLIGSDERLQYAEHIVGGGEKLFAAMCREGYEGIVSKRADAPYRGDRTRNWLKVKCTHRQEFLIIGWTESSARGRGFKSLLLGVNGPDGVVYSGKVGTGFDMALIEDLRAKLDRLAVDKPPARVPRAAARGAHWVRPELVAEVAFTEVTPEGALRHPSFIGLREDKPAAQVVAERPAPTSAPAATPAPPSKVKITHPDRVIFPDSSVTKGDLAAYYQAVAPLMLVWAARRPISLVRCPQGRGKACFFQKHDAGSFGDAVHHVDIREKDGSVEPYLYIEDSDGLLTCVQMGTIEFHGWGSSVDSIEQPDRLIIDLDPDEGLGFDRVKAAAEFVRDRLAEIGLVSFPMLSGGKGVHVVVPLTPGADWPAVKSFASRFAEALALAHPDRFTATMSKAKRKGRIFIDWLRNQRGSTAVLPYSARARAGAPVAAPVSWTELRSIDTAARLHVGDQDELLKRAAGRSLAGWGQADQLLPRL